MHSATWCKWLDSCHGVLYQDLVVDRVGVYVHLVVLTLLLALWTCVVVELKGQVATGLLLIFPLAAYCASSAANCAFRTSRIVPLVLLFPLILTLTEPEHLNRWPTSLMVAVARGDLDTKCDTRHCSRLLPLWMVKRASFSTCCVPD